MVECLRKVLPALVAFLAGECLGGPVAGDISPLELKALEARRAVQRGQIELEGTYWKSYKSGDQKTWLYRRVIYFDGARLRIDDFEEYDPHRAKLHGKYYRSVRCFNQKEHISYSDQILPNGHTIALTLRPAGSTDPSVELQIDPRVIGMVPDTTANLAHHTLETVVGRPDRQETSVEEVVLNGDRCTLVRYTRNDGLIARIWICPAKNFSVVKMQVEASASEAQYVDTVECSVGKYQPSGVWFPERCTYTRLVGGKPTREERAKIKVVSLNQALPENTFTLAGIGIPPGKRVYRVPEPPGTRGEYWDGEKIVPLEAEGTVPSEVWSTTRLVLVAISLIAAIVVVIVSVRFRKRQTS